MKTRLVVPAQVAHFTGNDAAMTLRLIADWFEANGAACIAVINTGDNAGTWQVVAEFDRSDPEA